MPASVGSWLWPLAGTSVASAVSAGTAESRRPVALASPQSTTSVSPYWPSMTLAGFRSRWSTPRLWAYATASQTSTNRPSKWRSRRDRPVGIERGGFVVEPLDRLLQAVALHEPHRVERAAVGVRPQSVHGDDAGMLQVAVDLGLQHEPGAEVRVVGLVGPDLLQCDPAPQLLVAGDVHLAEPPSGVWAKHPEPRAGR